MIIGLTGQTGAGKSTVCEFLSEKCIRSIDCDALSREVTADNAPALSEIEEAFSGVVSDGALDRLKLGMIVFNDPEKKALLESILFPHIIKKVKELINELECEEVVVLDAPTLFESGLNGICHKIVAVVAPESERLKRILSRDRIDEVAAHARMSSQHTAEWFAQHCDAVIQNDGDTRTLYTKISDLLKEWGVL